MKPGPRRYGLATLSIAIPQALPERMQGQVRELIQVHVPEANRHQGLASELLTRTVKEARRTRTTLMLIAEASLEGFYQRFGFKAIQRDPVLMVCR